MAKIYDFKDYKRFIGSWIEEQPKGGRGQYAKLAEVSGLHKASISHIFKGQHSLSLEQAQKIAIYLGLGVEETNYFFLLVNYNRAGTASLRDFLGRQIETIRTEQTKLVNRVTRSRELASEERAVFYSNWAYSAVRILSSIPGMETRDSIFRRLGLSRPFGNRIVDFLVRTDLCVEVDGKLGMGPQMTHLESQSPLIARHHGNWRVKAMERHPMLRSDDELSYTAPMSLSAEDVLRVRAFLADLVQRVDEVVGPSACERLYCLNIDWFEIK